MAEPRIVLISGKQGSGKSTLTAMLCEKMPHRVVPMKMAGPLYRIQEALRKVILEELGIDIGRKHGPLLQLLGEGFRQIFGEDVWLNAAKRRILVEEMGSVPNPQALISGKPAVSDKIYVFDDIRYPNELNAFHTAIKVSLRAPEHIRKPRTDSWRENVGHAGEIALDDVPDREYHVILDTARCSPEECLDHLLKAVADTETPR